MLDYADELEEIARLIAGHPHGMSITEIAAATGIGRNRVAKFLDVLTFSGRTGLKLVGNAKVFYCIDRLPVTSMLNLSSDYIIVVNSTHEVVYVSDNLLADELLRQQEVIGTNISTLHLSLLPFPNLRDYIQQALGGEELMTEYAVETGGTPRWFRAKMIPTALEGGAAGAGMVLEEITDLKTYQAELEERIQSEKIRMVSTTDDLKREKESHTETETALRISERRYRSLVEHTREGIVVLDPEDALITYVNPAITDMLGYSHGEMHGRSIFTFTNDTGVRMLREAQTQHEKENTERAEIELFRRDGRAVHGEISSAFVPSPTGTGMQWLLLLTDVTERIEQEKAVRFTNILLEGIIEGSDRMIATLDPDFAFVTSNAAYQREFERVFGIPPQNGMTLDELLSHLPGELKKARRLWGRALEGEDYRVIERFGPENEYEIRFIPLRDRNGNIFGAANLLYDITTLEKAVTTFQEQDIQLQKLLKQSASSPLMPHGMATPKQKSPFSSP